MESFLSGAFAGLVVDVALYPLDTLKTRIQAGKRIAGGFYRGIGALLLGSVPSSAIFFLCFDTTRQSIGLIPAAILSETIAALTIRIPVEVLKQNMQAGQAPLIFPFLKLHGLRFLYTGSLAMLFRDVPFALVQYPLFSILKGISQDNLLLDALSGAVAGGVAAAITNPLDVCKTRAMVCKEPDRPWRMIVDIVKNRMAWHGLLQRTSAIAIGGFIYFGAYSAAKQAFQGAWMAPDIA
jgi:solute carrier family 25 S-adenosylmethionine transporter 26